MGLRDEKEGRQLLVNAREKGEKINAQFDSSYSFFFFRWMPTIMLMIILAL